MSKGKPTRNRSHSKGISPRLIAKIERGRARDIKAELARDDWRDGLKPSDWLFDGYPIRGEHALERWRRLDWSKAWVDMGPSIAGNPGPYWHVPLKRADTVHRLYPKILQTKWLPLIRRAILEVRSRKGSP